MMSALDWKDYLTQEGNFKLPVYLYEANKDLMKQTLDLGTLMSEDEAKKRAFKEQIKKLFKQRWRDMADALEFFEVIEPCGCKEGSFCGECRGSRFVMNQAVQPKQLQEIAFVYGDSNDPDLHHKLEMGMVKVLDTLGIAPQ